MSDEPITDAPLSAEEQESPSPERPPDESPSTPTTDEPEGGDTGDSRSEGSSS